MKIKCKFTFYGDEHKQELNPDCYINTVAMLVLGRVMLNVFRLRSSLDFFSTIILSIKKCSPLALTSSPITYGILILRESQKIREEKENKALCREGLLGF